MVEQKNGSIDSKQNYAFEVEEGVNTQINNELSASYIYLAMSNYCRRTDVALPGASQYFLNQSNEERQHAQKLIDYQNDRGGKVELFVLKAPPKQVKIRIINFYKIFF